jgi:hypothetical protein
VEGMMNVNIYNTQKLKGIKEYNEKTKLNFSDLEIIFKKKNYELITKEYINNKQDLEFICNKHPFSGIQKTNAVRLRKLPHNCIECQKEYNHVQMIKRLSEFSPLEWYKKVLNKEIKTFPNGLFQYYKLEDLKELLLYFIEYAKEKENCEEKDLFTQRIFYKYKLSSLYQMYPTQKIAESVFKDKYMPWELSSVPPHYWESEDNIKFASKWFYNKLFELGYIKTDDDILEIKDFGSIFKKLKLDGFYYTVFKSSHYNFWNYMFPNRWFEWEFKFTQKHYWELKENRIRAFKELIEKLNLQLSEIPDKITYPFLVENYRKFSAICDIHYQSDLFSWVNDCYPNMFTKEDFHNNIANDGTILDSKHEVLIHNLMLKNGLQLKYFENKQSAMKNYYNEEENEYYVPDWIVNDNLIIEYFGWYNIQQYNKNKTITSYINKANRKIAYYEKQQDYKFIALYPNDLDENFYGLINKFNNIGIKLVV